MGLRPPSRLTTVLTFQTEAQLQALAVDIIPYRNVAVCNRKQPCLFYAIQALIN